MTQIITVLTHKCASLMMGWTLR